MRTILSTDDPLLLPYRLRAVRVGVQLTYLVVGVLVVFPLLGGDVEHGWAPYAVLVAAATVGAVLVRLLPWGTLFSRGLGVPMLYAWSVLDIVLISVGVAMTDGAGSPVFILYALTTVFFAAVYPRLGQVALLAFTFAAYTVVLAIDGHHVAVARTFMELSGLALVGVMGSFLSRELLDQMAGERDARSESESRAGLLARVASAARRMSTVDPEEVLLAAVDTARDLGFDGAAVVLFNGPTKSWQTAKAGGMVVTRTPVGRLDDEGDVPGAVRVAGRTTVLRDVADHPSGMHSLVGSPMLSGGERIGVLVAGRVSAARPVRPHEVEAIDLLAAHAGTALNNARLFDERRAFERRLAHQAFHDSLTGLANRTLFLERLGHAMAHRHADHGHAHGHGQLAVLFLDLDRFKLVNDSLGHDAGDDLLKLVGDRLSACIRPADTLARYGGDEFTVLLESVADAAAAIEVAERLLATLTSPFRIRGREVVLGGSIGIALAVPGTGADPLREADLAMYRAKERGKGRWELFEAELNIQALRRLEAETELRRGIENGELFLVYQPIVALGSNRIVGVEALARWRHPKRGVVPPSEFIPLAEEVGLIAPLGEWVVDEACRQGSSWLAAGLPPLQMAVNLAAAQFQPSLPARIAAAIDHAGFPARLLTLEVTESMVMADPDVALSVMDELRALGVGLALDDFGQGYSSLTRLKRLPLQTLKVDRAFIEGVVDNTEDRAIVRSVVSLAGDLGIAVTAEGIETEAQLAMVREMGCEMGQGYYLSMPVAADEIQRLLAPESQKSRELSSGTVLRAR